MMSVIIVVLAFVVILFMTFIYCLLKISSMYDEDKK